MHIFSRLTGIAARITALLFLAASLVLGLDSALTALIGAPITATVTEDNPISAPDMSGFIEEGMVIPAEEGTRAPETEPLPFEENNKEEGIRIVERDLSRGASPGEILTSNETPYDPDFKKLLALPYPIEVSLPAYSDAAEPLVLIIHTHGTEAFTPEGVTAAESDTAARSDDTSENIVAVGTVMTEVLREAGIPTLHCEIMHDLESYTYSYDYSLETVLTYLEEYPSIKYIFDVHRDAITTTAGDIAKLVCEIDGELTAQVMTVVGTDHRGADHGEWQDNLRVAATLQDMLTRQYPGIARPINIRSASFHQQYSPGFLLLEVGSAGNTLTEAKRAGKILAGVIADMIKAG